tara:strand:+ start:262 stop:471 length:210 start_codon:yes stop_codon:yes gene_type:complete
MATFKNNHPHDVYVDFGKLLLVQPGETITLEGALSCPPLTVVMEEIPPKPPAKKKVHKKSKPSSVSGTI